MQHDPLTLPPDDFGDMSTADAVELIREWFFGNFEDPAVETSYERCEGGYQYIWGGRYNTRDIVESVFANTASGELIRAAIDSIEADRVEWVPNGNRRHASEEDEDGTVGINPTAMHDALLQRLDETEEALAKLPEPSPGIGVNAAASIQRESRINVCSLP